MRRVLLLIAIVSTIGWLYPIAPGPPAPSRARPGWALYDRYCLACHGEAGDGKGPAAPFTAGRPRDFTRGDFAWRTTPLGAPPTDDDLRITIRHGAPGTSMPGFALADGEVQQLIEIVKSFAPAAFANPGTPIILGAPPKPNAARGAELWVQKGCVACHGPTGSGDTPVARTVTNPPYDLIREPLHRPRADDDVRRATALAIATGRTPMPGYAGAVPDADIWALADHVLGIGVAANTPTGGDIRGDTRQRAALGLAQHPRRKLDARAIDLDRTARIVAGTWPAAGDDAQVFGTLLAPQGEPPKSLAPVQASLSAQQCARCHAKQYREWETSLHHGAASAGLAAQMMGLEPAEAVSCLRCHAPLAEQQQRTDDRLRAQGATCAGCHVRKWTRHGPPSIAPSLLQLPGYPLEPLAIYERADFCLPCHQLPPRTAVEGRPLLDTYREWLEGPYMARGIQCQHCHMPNREHTFAGIHDQHTFRQGIALAATAHVKTGAVTVVAELTNIGAGHYLPTTPTPAVWLQIALVDAGGTPIAGATAYVRIGRDIYFDGSWHERADTRIAPGDTLVMSRAWSGGRALAATTARVSVIVSPDDYYEHLYERRLAGKLEPARRTLYEQALARAKADHYTATQRDIAIPH